jgi:hypothetical protein
MLQLRLELRAQLVRDEKRSLVLGHVRDLRRVEREEQHVLQQILVAGDAHMSGYSTRTGRYTFDGKPWVNEQPDIDARLSTVLSWDGPTLVFTTAVVMRGQKLRIIDRWSLDTTGKILTRAHRLEEFGTSLKETQVFTRR